MRMFLTGKKKLSTKTVDKFVDEGGAAAVDRRDRYKKIGLRDFWSLLFWFSIQLVRVFA